MSALRMRPTALAVLGFLALTNVGVEGGSGPPPAPESEEMTSLSAAPTKDPSSPLRLTLDDALSLALEQSYEARSLRLELLRAEQNAAAARGRFRTFADLTLQVPNYDQRFSEKPVPGAPSVFDQTEALQWESRLSLNQPLPTDGLLSLEGSLRLLQTETFLPQDDIRFDDNRFFSTLRFSLRQPLLVPNELQLGRERAELALESARLEYTRTELDVVYRVTDAFYALVAAQRRLEIAEGGFERQREAADLARRKFEAGLVPEVEALQMQVDLAGSERDLLRARTTLERARDDLRLAVGLDLVREVEAAAGIEVPRVEIDEDFALRHALEHATRLRQDQINRRLAEMTMEETDARRSVRGDLRAFYDISGISDDDLRGSDNLRELLDSSLDDLRERPQNKGISLALTVPLWDSGVNAAEVAAARAQLDRRVLDAQENRRRLETTVRATLARVREARQSLDVSMRSEEVARRSYEISRARYDNGEITSQDLALDRDRLLNAQVATLDASVQLRLALADLARQTFYDFERGRSLVGGMRGAPDTAGTSAPGP